MAIIKETIQTSRMNEACLRQKYAEVCRQRPDSCGLIKETFNHYREVREVLFYFGRYHESNATASSEPLTIPIFIDRINSDSNLFLASQKGPALFSRTAQITVPLKAMRQRHKVVVLDGTYVTALSLAPYSVTLLELSMISSLPRH